MGSSSSSRQAADPRLSHADDVAEAQFEQRYGDLELLSEDVQGAMGMVYRAAVKRGVHMGAHVIAKKVNAEPLADLESDDVVRLKRYFDEAGQSGGPSSLTQLRPRRPHPQPHRTPPTPTPPLSTPSPHTLLIANPPSATPSQTRTRVGTLTSTRVSSYS